MNKAKNSGHVIRRLKDGDYLAKCREKTSLQAMLNGHGDVWPEAKLVVSGEEARFFKKGKLVWRCNMLYAANQFEVSEIPANLPS